MTPYDVINEYPKTFEVDGITFNKRKRSEQIDIVEEFGNRLRFFKGNEGVYLAYLIKTPLYTGTQLLNKFSKFSKKIGAKYLYLKDKSERTCEDRMSKIFEINSYLYPYPYSLFLYLTGEKGFYAKNGFYPVKFQEDEYKTWAYSLIPKDFSDKSFTYLFRAIDDQTRRKLKSIGMEEYMKLTIKDALKKMKKEECPLIQIILNSILYGGHSLSHALRSYPLYWRKDL